MKKNMVTICSGDLSLPSCSFEGELHFFKLKLNIVQNGDHICISLDVKRGEEIDSLVLLAEFRIVVGTFEFFIDKDMLSKSEQLWSTGVRKCRGNVLLQARLLDILPTYDITMPSKLRKTQILCYNSVYYVDIERLADIGGYLFIEWKKIKDEGQTRIVATIDERDLDILLTAVIKHDFITVHRRNYMQLCEIGERYRILPLLRAVEQFLMDAHIHPMRRLELSVEMRMARLYDLGLRQMGAPHVALKKLHQYLAENGESINDIHPKLLSALNINPDYVCIS